MTNVEMGVLCLQGVFLIMQVIFTIGYRMPYVGMWFMALNFGCMGYILGS